LTECPSEEIIGWILDGWKGQAIPSRIRKNGESKMNREEYQQMLVNRAIELGALHAVIFNIDDIVFDPRTLLKCMYGCDDWGKGLTCPSRPGSLKPDEYEKILRRYSWGIIVHAHDKKTTQEVSFKLEQEAFWDGYHFAFSMSDCALCSKCAGCEGKECRFPKKARPAFHSVGIDVFSTVRKFGLPIKTLRTRDDEQNWYAAVFVE